MAKGMSAQQIAAKWSTNLSGATTTITTGVNAAQNTWAANVAAVPLASWQSDMINKGVPRISTGAQAAQPKMANTMNALLPAIAQIKSTLPARGNLQQNLARANQFATALSQQKGKFKG
jgi:hypothetical protein